MVPILAVQSVEKKMEMQASVMLGNYEFYYGAGKLSALTQLDADADTPSQALGEAVKKALEQFAPADEGTAYLAKMLKKYKPDESYDAHMAELFQWGAQGRKPVH